VLDRRSRERERAARDDRAPVLDGRSFEGETGPVAMTLTDADADALERCLAEGGIAVFPADTVYGLACDPGSAAAVARLYELKGRPPDKPAAVLFFARKGALAALLPGAVTLLLPNAAGRFALACGPDPTTLGLRVPALAPALAALAAVGRPLLQSSANRAGGPDARTLHEVPAAIRAQVDLVLDGGELPGTPSTVVDLRGYEREGRWSVLRVGAVSHETLRARLDLGRSGDGSPPCRAAQSRRS
jgi:L-threonylcarbamoyladenylate synthase